MSKPDMPQQDDWDETTATARLPNLDIEVRHRRAWSGDAEQLQVTLHATPSFEAVLPMFTAPYTMANPMMLWMRMVEAAWSPWLSALTPPTETRRIDSKD